MIDIVAIVVVLIAAAALLRLARRTPRRRDAMITAPTTHPPLELYRSPVGGSYLPAGDTPAGMSSAGAAGTNSTTWTGCIR